MKCPLSAGTCYNFHLDYAAGGFLEESKYWLKLSKAFETGKAPSVSPVPAINVINASVRVASMCLKSAELKDGTSQILKELIENSEAFLKNLKQMQEEVSVAANEPI